MTTFLIHAAERAAQRGALRLAAWLCRAAVALRADDAALFHRAVDLLFAAGAIAAAESLCRGRLRVRAADAAALVRLAFLLLDTGRAEESVAHFRAIDRYDGVPADDTAVFVCRRLDLPRVRAGTPYYRWMEDVRIETACWTVMQGGDVYNDDVHAKNLAASPFVRGRQSADATAIVAALPAPYREIGESCILVGGDDNYSHWLFRNMLKLSSLDGAGLLHAFPWVVNDDLRGYQTEYMRLLGHDPAHTVRVERAAVIRCARVLVPALHVHPKSIAQGVQWMRARMASLCTAPATRRLFLSRRDNGRRRVLNEDELYAAVAPLGFERIVPGEMPVAAQISAFGAARIIVAAHGAGLTNMIFTPPGAAIVELTSTAIEHMDLFRMLSKSTGHSIQTLCSDDYDVPAQTVNVNADYRVDVQQVRQAVEAALAHTGD